MNHFPSTPQQTELTRRSLVAAAGAGVLASGLAAFGQAARPPVAPVERESPGLPVPKGPPEKKVGYAIVGLGQLALEEVLPALSLCEKTRVAALVSGHPDKARKVAEHYGVDPKAIYNYDTFDKLADNPDVQVVYVILPNSMHEEFTVRAAKAGKHVLCEKPMAMDAAACKRMIDACAQAKRKLMIAYRLRHEPYNQAAIEVMRKKELGKLVAFQSSNFQQQKAPNYRLSATLGGGPMFDIGIYCLNAARYISGEEPTEVWAAAHRPTDDPRFQEVPGHCAWMMRFPSGVVANCSVGFDAVKSNSYQAICENGVLELNPSFSYENLAMRVAREQTREERRFPQVNHFASEMDHFSDCVTNDKPPLTPGEEGLADLKVIDRINESINSGKSLKV